MSKRRRRKGLLDSQKPKRRHRLLRLARRLIAPTVFIVGAVIAGSYLRQSFQNLGLPILRHDQRPDLQIVGNSPLVEENLIRDSYRQIIKVDDQELRQLSNKLHEKLGLRKISLIKSTPQKINIETEAFAAVMIIDLDHRRYITEDGIIFGEAKNDSIAIIPILKGLDRHSALQRSAEGTFVASGGNQKIIEEALLAIQEGKRYNINYRNLDYDEFRGISGDLDSSNFRVTLGFKPFNEKYLKLEKILLSLKERGLSSATIELDYKGKAFVKESIL